MKYIVKSQASSRKGYCYCDKDCNDCSSYCSSVCNSYKPSNTCSDFCGAVVY